MHIKLSIIVPCYNEAPNLPHISQLFGEVFQDKPGVEIILVNNGSTDNSAAVFEAVFAGNTLFKVVTVLKNEGYGNGILYGLNAARGSVLAWTHADLQTHPGDVWKAYTIFENLKDDTVFVKGRRAKRGLTYDFFSKGMQIVASVALQTKLVDIGAQPKLFSKAFFDRYLKNKAPFDFSLDLYALFWAKRTGKIVEFPVVMTQRLFGEAKGGGSWKTRIKVSIRTFKFILAMRKSLIN